MNFISILRTIGGVAETVGKDTLEVAGPALSAAAVIDPALGPVAALVSGISRSVLAQAATPASASAKKDAVLTTVEAITPVLSELLLAKSGHSVTDTARFQQGVDQAIEGILNIYKSFGAIPVAPAPRAVVS